MTRWAVSLVASRFAPISLSAQESKATPNFLTADKIVAMTKPGPEHETIAKYVGEWDVEVTLGVKPRPRSDTGHSRNMLVVGKRFLQMEFKTNPVGNPGSFDLTEAFSLSASTVATANTRSPQWTTSARTRSIQKEKPTRKPAS